PSRSARSDLPAPAAPVAPRQAGAYPDIVKARGEIAQALVDVLARKVPGLHSVHIATLGEDGRHIGVGSIGYASHEIAKGGLGEILEWAYANSPRSANSQRAGSK